jgi:ribosomal protein S18 acetylase RimI-like enzyme
LASALCRIRLAAGADVPGILDLQACNLPDKGGLLSVGFPATWFEAAIAAMPVIVAARGSAVVGYLVSAPFPALMNVPIVQAMLRAYPGSPDGYLYGPICVAEAERGQGIAQAMFSALRAELPGREGIAFIRRDNVASLRAHRRMGMREVAEFDFDGVAHVIIATAA